MDLDRGRFQRNSSLSRGTSSYVSPSTGLQQGVPANDSSMRIKKPVQEELPGAVVPVSVAEKTDNSDTQEWLRAWASDTDALVTGGETWQQATPKRQKKSNKQHPRLIKSALYSIGVFVLFGASVGAGVYSVYREQSQSTKEVAAATTTEPSNSESNTGLSVTPGGLKVTQAGSSIQLQNTGANIDLRQYTDSYQGSDITIAVQALPDNFKTDPATALKDFAQSINATEQIETANFGTVYILTDRGAQLLVLVANNKFVALQSLGTQTTEAWKTYFSDEFSM